MSQNKTFQTLINISLYLALFIAMTYMIFLLSQYTNPIPGAVRILRLDIGILAVVLVLVMVSTLDFRNKKFEAKTIWSRNLTLFFFLNLALSSYLWVYTFSHLGYPESGLQNGLWGFNSSELGDLGWEYCYYFQPLLGVLGLIISLSTFCNIKYRLNKADYRKIFIELLPIFAVGILIFCHYNFIEKPYFNG
ncbi:MAG: hypothetical protein R3E32_10745 [Chitinophagales bacterium]